jgi:hypothetical protein
VTSPLRALVAIRLRRQVIYLAAIGYKFYRSLATVKAARQQSLVTPLARSASSLRVGS